MLSLLESTPSLQWMWIAANDMQELTLHNVPRHVLRLELYIGIRLDDEACWDASAGSHLTLALSGMTALTSLELHDDTGTWWTYALTLPQIPSLRSLSAKAVVGMQDVGASALTHISLHSLVPHKGLEPALLNNLVSVHVLLADETSIQTVLQLSPNLTTLCIDELAWGSVLLDLKAPRPACIGTCGVILVWVNPCHVPKPR